MSQVLSLLPQRETQVRFGHVPFRSKSVQTPGEGTTRLITPQHSLWPQETSLSSNLSTCKGLGVEGDDTTMWLILHDSRCWLKHLPVPKYHRSPYKGRLTWFVPYMCLKLTQEGQATSDPAIMFVLMGIISASQIVDPAQCILPALAISLKIAVLISLTTSGLHQFSWLSVGMHTTGFIPSSLRCLSQVLPLGIKIYQDTYNQGKEREAPPEDNSHLASERQFCRNIL